MTDPIESRRPRGTVALEAAAQRIAAGGSDGPLRQRLPDGPVTPETLDRVAYIIDTRPAPSTTAADCRAALVDWATRERTARDEDDGSREYAVKAWGEDKLTEHELATVSRYSHLGADFFRRLGIPEETIQKGLSAEPNIATHQIGTRPDADAHREPYVGEGADGCYRSAQIDREEADGLDRSDPRHDEVLASAEAWEQQAAQVALRSDGVRRPENERPGPTNPSGGPTLGPSR